MKIKTLAIILVSALLLSGSPHISAVRYTLIDFLNASNNYRADESAENLHALLNVYDNLNQYYKLGADRELKNNFDTTAEELANLANSASFVTDETQDTEEIAPIAVSGLVEEDNLEEELELVALEKQATVLPFDEIELYEAIEQSQQEQEEYEVAKAVEESFESSVEAQKQEYLRLQKEHEEHNVEKAIELSLDDLVEQTKRKSLVEYEQSQVAQDMVMPTVFAPIAEQAVLPTAETHKPVSADSHLRVELADNQVNLIEAGAAEIIQEPFLRFEAVEGGEKEEKMVTHQEQIDNRFERDKKILAEMSINPRVQYVMRSDELSETAAPFDAIVHEIEKALGDDPENRDLRLRLTLMDCINNKIQEYIAKKIAEDTDGDDQAIQTSVNSGGYIENSYIRNKAKIQPNLMIQSAEFKKAIQEFVDTFLTDETLGKWLKVSGKWTYYFSWSNDQYYIDTDGLEALNEYLNFVETIGKIMLSTNSNDQKLHDLECLEEDFADCINNDPMILGHFDTCKDSFKKRK